LSSKTCAGASLSFNRPSANGGYNARRVRSRRARVATRPPCQLAEETHHAPTMRLDPRSGELRNLCGKRSSRSGVMPDTARTKSSIGHALNHSDCDWSLLPAVSVEIVKQSHDTKGFVVLPRRWVGCARLNIDGERQGDLVRHGGERRAVLHTRSTHPGIGKPGSVEAISVLGNSERISPPSGCPMGASVIAVASGVRL
jgi:hypothetical protein